MPAPFITYYEAIAKLAQVANKQTMFLSHILYNMEFSREHKQYIVDMSTAKKISIMKEISPAVKDSALLNLGNQYLNKLKKADFIRPVGRGIWLVNPMCYGKFRMISKHLRTENTKVYANMIFGEEGLEEIRTRATTDVNGEERLFNLDRAGPVD